MVAVPGFLEGLPYAAQITQALSFVISFLAIYIVGRMVLRLVLDHVMERKDLHVHVRKPLKKVAHLIVIFVAFAVSFGIAGFGSFLTALATISAAATLAVGFAMQNVIRNFVSGVLIFVEKPFKIGDWIEWGDGNSGIVEDISMRVTRVKTFDNELLTVPNSDLTDSVVKNPVAMDRLRARFTFGIDYDDDIEKATDVILEEAGKMESIMDDPEPSVRVRELADSYVGLEARVWIEHPSRSDFVGIKSDYVENVKNRFDEEGITIPFPHRTLEGSLDMG